jgi:hypothetical protein
MNTIKQKTRNIRSILNQIIDELKKETPNVEHAHRLLASAQKQTTAAEDQLDVVFEVFTCLGTSPKQ